jgi:hypothetical protein
MNDHSNSWRPGRGCPLHYRYPPSVFTREPELQADTLYVVGGLYGNRRALETLLGMLSEERGSTALIFNGDFNWFNFDDEGFETINTAVLSQRALRGNVETELATDDPSAGCGCGYPDSVPEADVARSNQILEQLRGTARRFPALRERLGQLPMHAVARVGDLRIGIVHGDAESLAGWQFDVSALDDSGQREQLSDIFASARVDGFASSHTCLPALRSFLSRAANVGSSTMVQRACRISRTRNSVCLVASLFVPHHTIQLLRLTGKRGLCRCAAHPLRPGTLGR